MDEDRLAWIYSAATPAELRERYDAWAAHYDGDMAGMDWSAPVAAARRCLAHAGAGATVLDAGCGTGQVGRALRAHGAGRVIGLDFSPGMLREAAASGAYDELLEASLSAPIPLPGASLDAIVSVGVFTFGHVPPAALANLTPLLRAGGIITLSFRDDVYRDLGFGAAIAELERTAGWTLLERGEPAPMVVEDGSGVDMRVWCWRIAR